MGRDANDDLREGGKAAVKARFEGAKSYRGKGKAKTLGNGHAGASDRALSQAPLDAVDVAAPKQPQRAMPERVHEKRAEKVVEKFKFFWAGEATEAEVPCLVKGLIPAIGKGLLSGQWGMLKTFVVLDLAASIVTENPFAGHRVMLTGGVLILAAEGASSLPRRINGLVQEGKLEPGVHPIVWMDTCPTLLADNAAAHLTELATEARAQMKARFNVELRAIVVDTVAAAAGWDNENDSAQGQAVMNVLERVSKEMSCAVIGVDHFGKAADGGTRGTSAKESAADFVLAITGDRDLSGKVSNTKLSVRKLRDGETGAEMPFTGRIVDLGIDHDGDAKTTLVIDWRAKETKRKPKWPGRLGILKKAFDAVLADNGQHIRPFGAEGPAVMAVDRNSLRREFMAAVVVDEEAKPNAKRQAFYKATKDAVNVGLLIPRELDGVTFFWTAEQAGRLPEAGAFGLESADVEFN